MATWTITSHGLTADLVMAIIIGAVKLVKELWGLNIAEAASTVDEVTKVFEIGLERMYDQRVGCIVQIIVALTS